MNVYGGRCLGSSIPPHSFRVIHLPSPHPSSIHQGQPFAKFTSSIHTFIHPCRGNRGSSCVASRKPGLMLLSLTAHSLSLSSLSAPRPPLLRPPRVLHCNAAPSFPHCSGPRVLEAFCWRRWSLSGGVLQGEAGSWVTRISFVVFFCAGLGGHVPVV